MPLEKGDKLILFTDGLFEQLNREMEEFTESRMAEVTKKLAKKPLRKIVDGLLENMDSHMQGSARTDDVTIMGVTYLGKV